ncbi:MAG: ABC transporter ATP-binding protein [Deltaproteobacteria bacterium]|nr:ABC transporter ATP-binding protein [Deltaproteobacteria bacterium]
MIRLQGITRTFFVGGQAVHALAGIDEHIRPGEHVAIMGPSGSGKSTLLNLLGCLDRPTSGTYTLDGREVGSLGESELTRVRRHLIGFVFQSYHLVSRLTAEENVELPMIFAEIPRGERRRKVKQALEAVDLTDRADHRPDQLSGGQRQRVALARSTVMGPRILLADEPTGNLDSSSGAQVLGLLEDLNQHGLTLIVVTHDPNVARRAQRTLVLRDGLIVRRLQAHEIGNTLPFEDLPSEAAATPPDSPPQGEEGSVEASPAGSES